MPVLKFLLTNNQLTYRAEKDSEEWLLVPDAKLQKNHSSFKVYRGSDIYDGFGLDGDIIIKQRLPQNIARSEELARVAQQASDGLLAETVIEGCLGTIVMGGCREFPPHFEIIILLPTDEFFRVQAYLETCLVYLSIQTCPFEGGLIFGDDPDGRDIKWLVDKVGVAIVESISLRFKPHPTDTLEPEIEPQDRLLPTPVVVNTSDLSSGINRLFWAVILVGLALILKAYV